MGLNDRQICYLIVSDWIGCNHEAGYNKSLFDQTGYQKTMSGLILTFTFLECNFLIIPI